MGSLCQIVRSALRALIPFFLLLVLASWLQGQESSPDLLSEIITNVKSNEALYGNLEVVVKSSYRLSPGVFCLPQSFSFSEERRRCVLQGNFMYTADEFAGEEVSKKRVSYVDIAGYDGEM